MGRYLLAAGIIGVATAAWWGAVRLLDSTDEWAFVDHPENDDDGDEAGGATVDELL